MSKRNRRNKKAPAAATAEAQTSNQTTTKGKDLMNTTTSTQVVNFHGAQLLTVLHNNEPHVAMKPVCEAIGLSWDGQRQRIARHEVLKSTACMIHVVASDGKPRELTCLPLNMLNGWLFGIDIKKCREEIRPKLIEYQRECFKALYDYWTQGEAVNPRLKTKTALPGGLSLEQQDAIKAMVRTKADAFPKDKRGAATIKCWSALKSKFGCTYKKIEPEHFTEALSLVARLDLEGELLPAGSEEPNMLDIVSITDLPAGRYLVHKHGNSVNCTALGNHALVPLDHVNALRKDVQQFLAAGQELLGRMRILHGEASITRFDNPLLP